MFKPVILYWRANRARNCCLITKSISVRFYKKRYIFGKNFPTPYNLDKNFLPLIIWTKIGIEYQAVFTDGWYNFDSFSVRPKQIDVL